MLKTKHQERDQDPENQHHPSFKDAIAFHFLLERLTGNAVIGFMTSMHGLPLKLFNHTIINWPNSDLPTPSILSAIAKRVLSCNGSGAISVEKFRSDGFIYGLTVRQYPIENHSKSTIFFDHNDICRWIDAPYNLLFEKARKLAKEGLLTVPRFPKFNEFPPEIRELIWKWAIRLSPRLVEVQNSSTGEKGDKMHCSYPLPGLAYACNESYITASKMCSEIELSRLKPPVRCIPSVDTLYIRRYKAYGVFKLFKMHNIEYLALPMPHSSDTRPLGIHLSIAFPHLKTITFVLGDDEYMTKTCSGREILVAPRPEEQCLPQKACKMKKCVSDSFAKWPQQPSVRFMVKANPGFVRGS